MNELPKENQNMVPTEGAPLDAKSSPSKSFPAELFLPASIVIAGIMISSTIYLTRGAAPLPSEKVEPTPEAPIAAGELTKLSERDVILGDPKAPITMIEYGDYQCGFCGRHFLQTVPQIKEKYIKTGKVRLIARNFAFLGPASFEAAEAAECAKDQGKFWVFHDGLYGDHAKGAPIDQKLFLEVAKREGMNIEEFTSCYEGNKYAEAVKTETAKAQSGGVRATPTFFINGQSIEGAQPFTNFEAVIDALLKENS